MRNVPLWGAEIWGWAEESKTERIQECYIKWLRGLEKTTPCDRVLKEVKKRRELKRAEEQNN